MAVVLITKTDEGHAIDPQQGCLLGKSAEGAGGPCKIASRDMRRGLIADTELEAGGTPINELDRLLRLDARNSRLNVLGNNVAAIKKAAGH
jgi:hypothetical protein